MGNAYKFLDWLLQSIANVYAIRITPGSKHVFYVIYSTFGTVALAKYDLIFIN